MHPTLTLVSSLLLTSGALAQYGSGAGSAAGAPAADAASSSSMMSMAAGSSSMMSMAAGSSSMMDMAAGSSSMMDMAASSTMPAMASGTAMASGAGAAAPSGMVTMHVVKVSNKAGALVFEPSDLKAAPGSMVQFDFYPKNHSVVQSTFDQPCQPISMMQPKTMGLFSGFMPVKAAAAAAMPVYTVMINDTKPIWYYCSQGDHCQQGMVGVINAPAANMSRTIDTFKALAKTAAASTSPDMGMMGMGMDNSTGMSNTPATMTNGTMPGSSAPGSASSSSVAQAKSAGPGSRYANRQDVLTGFGLASAVGLVIALIL